MSVVLTRSLVLLLAFRAVMAPYSYRLTTRDHAQGYSLVMRVCKWPPQRLERCSGSSKVLKLYEGKKRAASQHSLRLATLPARPCDSSPPAVCDSTLPSPSQLVSVLRC